ncbi:uncharacterized protein LY79DRAFT_549931 [Colletotrichum navitas]|uniref:Uncharacterized protein n=1 Tax=Colletotrichum navitas TaxID=681940 RepID=A0AAD8V6Z8_9PEZI|nr:uncharacterized protein LY79DRAFT_549931 [Colletotrichum navitas]KAK1594126.1 hypothetical protein LY79DRAFT_549931 [Colletotrichum navitas]
MAGKPRQGAIGISTGKRQQQKPASLSHIGAITAVIAVPWHQIYRVDLLYCPSALPGVSEPGKQSL